MSKRVSTIGVYGTSEGSFFKALTVNGVTHFVDIRRRRGMRGSQYSYANSGRLQQTLREMGIDYRHRIDLAPSVAARQAQKDADILNQNSKRSREALSPAFIAKYEEENLNGFDIRSFWDEFPANSHIVLFCVERSPSSCHRSLVSAHITETIGTLSSDITPLGEL